jgi:nitroreductase
MRTATCPAVDAAVDVRDTFREAVRHAVLAPSGHNAQPWLFRLRDDALELHADRTRALPVVDPHGRELIISCGAALFHAQAALRALGFAGEVELLPDASDPDFLARIRLGAPRAPTAADRVLVAAMPRRRTNRGGFTPHAIPPHVLSLLSAAAREEGAWLALVDTPAHREGLAAAVAQADRRQEADPRFRRELAAWIRPARSRRRDGMPGSALGVPRVLSALAPRAVAGVDLGAMLAAHDRSRVRHAPTLAVLMTTGDTPRDWLVAGQALARVALTACAAGVTASYFNQPLEVTELRLRVAELAREAVALQAPAGRDVLPSGALPQLVFRLGFASEVPPTPRRPVADVIR